MFGEKKDNNLMFHVERNKQKEFQADIKHQNVLIYGIFETLMFVLFIIYYSLLIIFILFNSFYSL